MTALLPAYRLPPIAYRPQRAGFTLIEIVAVMTLIAIFAGVIGFAFLRGGNQSVGLQAAQSTVSSLLTLVRSQAAVSGRNAALFVNVDSSKPDRYLRFWVPAVLEPDGTTWKPFSAGVLLTPGCYVVPASAPSSPSAVPGESWTGLNSTLIRGPVTIALESATAETWYGVAFTPRGTLALPYPLSGPPPIGNIVLATGRVNPPGASPAFVYVNPENVRGVAVSSFGLARMINDAEGF